MAEMADFELVQAVRGMDGRISDPNARVFDLSCSCRSRLGHVCGGLSRTQSIRATNYLQGAHQGARAARLALRLAGTNERT